jgi:cytochrome P450
MRPTDNAYFKGISVLDRLVNPYIEDALSTSEDKLQAMSDSGEELTFLQNIALYTRDRKVIRDQIIAVLLAGRDTSGASLSWALYELSHYPEEWEKLREEALATVGLNGRPTYESLKDMTYLRHIMHESLRLHPPIPFNVRSCRSSCPCLWTSSLH